MPWEAERSNVVCPKFTNKHLHTLIQTSRTDALSGTHFIHLLCVHIQVHTRHSRATVQLSLHGGPHTASRKELILDFLEQSEGSCQAAPRAARHRPPS